MIASVFQNVELQVTLTGPCDTVNQILNTLSKAFCKWNVLVHRPKNVKLTLIKLWGIFSSTNIFQNKHLLKLWFNRFEEHQLLCVLNFKFLKK